MSAAQSLDNRPSYHKVLEDRSEAVIENTSNSNNANKNELEKIRNVVLIGLVLGASTVALLLLYLVFFSPYSRKILKVSYAPQHKIEQKNINSISNKTQILTQTKPALLMTPVGLNGNSPAIVSNVYTSSASNELQNTSNIVNVPGVNGNSIYGSIVDSDSNIFMQSNFLDDSSLLNYDYDVQNNGLFIKVSGNQEIEVSRSSNFSGLYMAGRADENGVYTITLPPPGEIYWRDHSKLTNKIEINPPKPLQIEVLFPTIVKSNQSLYWRSSGDVSFYKIEVSKIDNMEEPEMTFSTTENFFYAKDIGVGNWFLRISGLNLQSGSWEYSKVISLDIQNFEKRETIFD